MNSEAENIRLRDDFAKEAMGRLVTGWDLELWANHVAKLSYKVADAMMKERERDDRS